MNILGHHKNVKIGAIVNTRLYSGRSWQITKIELVGIDPFGRSTMNMVKFTLRSKKGHVTETVTDYLERVTFEYISEGW